MLTAIRLIHEPLARIHGYLRRLRNLICLLFLYILFVLVEIKKSISNKEQIKFNMSSKKHHVS